MSEKPACSRCYGEGYWWSCDEYGCDGDCAMIDCAECQK